MIVRKNKIKVIWICHFTNAEIQSFLPLRKQKDEFASWIPNILKGFEDSNEIEIHVISPHEYLKKDTNLTIRNINYYFISYGIPFWHRHWPGTFRFDIFSDFFFIRRRVKKLITRIQPDLINLIGAENTYYSSSILDFKDVYPSLVTIQGFISQLRDAIKSTQELRKKIDIEEQILKSFKYFCGEQDSSTYIYPYNPDHIFFRFYFPVNEDLVVNTVDVAKKYDCIYFGILSQVKGTDDFIKVIAELKANKPDIKAIIIGGGKSDQYKTLAKELNCSKNIEFIGFVKSQKELFEYVKASRVFLAPPHKERLSSTIREAMFLKVPIVAYATGGIPYINEFDEHIYLVETGDYKEMAQKALLLLKDEHRRDKLAEKAYEYCINEFSLKVNTERLLTAYHTIIDSNKEEK